MDTVAQVGGGEQGVAEGVLSSWAHAGDEVAQGGELLGLDQVFEGMGQALAGLAQLGGALGHALLEGLVELPDPASTAFCLEMSLAGATKTAEATVVPENRVAADLQMDDAPSGSWS